MKILHTRNMEAAARALAGKYPRVLVRNKCVLWHPVRLQREALADLSPHIVLNPPAFDSQLAAWNRTGGMLIYDRAYQSNENIVAHHAQLLTECPLSVSLLESYIEGTHEIAVIYRPPTWSEHERCVHDFHPDADICRRFYEIVVSSKRDVDGHRVCSDQVMSDALGLSVPQLWRVRRALFRTRDYFMVTQVILRIEPPDRTLAEVYRWILRECPEVGGVRMIRGKSLSKCVAHWRVALRSLERCGAIAREDTIFSYRPDELGPNWTRIESVHNAARARLVEIAKLIDASPELTLPPETHSPRSRAQSARSQSMSPA